MATTRTCLLAKDGRVLATDRRLLATNTHLLGADGDALTTDTRFLAMKRRLLAVIRPSFTRRMAVLTADAAEVV